MSHAYNPLTAIPDDGDAADAESVNVAFRQLADRAAAQSAIDAIGALNQVTADGSTVNDSPTCAFFVPASPNGARWLWAGTGSVDFIRYAAAPTNNFDALSVSSSGAGSGSRRGFASNADGSIIVAVGASAEIKVSTNGGTSWTNHTAGSSYTGDFRDVTFGVGLFVAVGDTGEIQTSPDGVTWTRRETTSSYNLFSVAFNGVSDFVAVGTNGEIRHSTNGTSWSHQTSSLGTGVFWAKVRWSQVGNTLGIGRFVAFSTGLVMASSPGGTTWTVEQGGLPSLAPITFADAVHCKQADLWCIVGFENSNTNDPLVLVGRWGRDGWRRLFRPGHPWLSSLMDAHAVATDGERFMIATHHGHLLYTGPCRSQAA